MYLLAGNGELSTLRSREAAFPWARRLVDRLIEKRRRAPEVAIAAILDTQTPDDPRRTRRGEGPLVRHLLAEAGIAVLNANLFGTRFDRARRFPPIARFHHQRWRSVPLDEWVHNQQRWQTWHNVEDHRKNLVIDRGAWGVITSHNAIDVASDWHENAFLVGPPLAGALWEECRAALASALELPQRIHPDERRRLLEVAERPAHPVNGARSSSFCANTASLSSCYPPLTICVEENARQASKLLHRSAQEGASRAARGPAPVRAELLASTAIRPRILEELEALSAGDAVRVASTYFSDQQVLNALFAAAGRGVSVQVLIDDCAGLPLGPVAGWLVRNLVNLRCTARARARAAPGFELRVHRSADGRMMHLKTAAFLGRRRVLIGGQANYTPNSFTGAWLETNVLVEGGAPLEDFLAQFEQLWQGAAPLPPQGPGGRLWTRGLLALLGLFERLGFRP